ncbi:MAG: TIGR00725 family protein [Candidatus Krumholzibacteria bacterium]|nr:TIGR00725 family protein [Candidatus Krumholzibacteria bacterium]
MNLIGVIGSGACSEQVRQVAYDIGKGIAQAGYPLICGGLGGVMEGACEGAFDAGGLTIGVIPGDSAEAANPYVMIPIVTAMGFARNAIIVKSASVLIAIEGGPGTLSEVAFALQFGVPVISLNSFDVSPDLIQVQTAQQALSEALARL